MNRQRVDCLRACKYIGAMVCGESTDKTKRERQHKKKENRMTKGEREMERERERERMRTNMNIQRVEYNRSRFS